MQAVPQMSEVLSPAQAAEVMLGSVFVFVGVVSLAISAIRHRKSMSAITWFGLLSFLYGLRLLLEARAFVGLLSPSLMPIRQLLMVILTHVVLIPAILVWYDLSTGVVRKVSGILAIGAAVVAAAGISNALLTPNQFRFMPINNVLAILVTIMITVVILWPRLAKRYLVVSSPVLATGSVILGIAVLRANLATFVPIRRGAEFEPLAFGIFVFSIGYVAIERVLRTEGRLRSIEQELDVAREIQRSILPDAVPKVSGLKVAATYHPAASVAGDFYEFVQLDERRIGFLVADVSGHGVPAALIASMIKVAMHAVEASAANPSEVMKGLNRILTQQLKGQFVTAAYLYLDLHDRLVRYAAAGHPAMVRWNGLGQIERVESNGLLFGVLAETEYPSVELPVTSGDRFLLYSDGLTETENAAGEPFDAERMAAVIKQNISASVEQVSETLFRESVAWQPASLPQQDDVTMLLVEVL